MNKRAKVAEIRDRRRFKEAPVATGEIHRVAAPDATGTAYPNTVLDWRPDIGEPILKDGAHNSKIGGDVLVGWNKGARIYTYSLEERATCPRACEHWLTCYGNALDKTRRWRHGPAFETGLASEIEEACRRHQQVLIRPHIVGDFYSTGYVRLWAEMLDRHDNLAAFGFTAHRPGTEIGDAVAEIRGRFGRRFSIRHSGTSGQWGSASIDFPTRKKRIGDAIVCPEQLAAIDAPQKQKHCGNCAVCWQTDHPIIFLEH